MYDKNFFFIKNLHLKLHEKNNGGWVLKFPFFLSLIYSVGVVGYYWVLFDRVFVIYTGTLVPSNPDGIYILQVITRIQFGTDLTLDD